jgi:hypothetical protein
MKVPTQRECDTFYGNPRGQGGSVVSQKWYRENIVFVPVPWPMKMGSINITRIAFHKKAAEALQAVFAEIKATMSMAEIKEAGLTEFSGSFNYRPMRGGSALSMHAYGCAIDFDAANNGLGDRTPKLAKYPKVIKAFLNQGAIWGGDWDGDGDTLDERRCDGMHFQFARLG